MGDPHTPPPAIGSDALDLERLTHYLAGECSDAEARGVEAWIAVSPDRARQVNALRAIWVRAERLPLAADSEADWPAVAERIDVARLSPTVATVRPRLRTAGVEGRGQGSAWWAAVAASVAVVAMGIGLTIRHRMPRSSIGHEYVTASGQRATVSLPDGTRITLAPASHLHVAADYAHDRGVALEGEAVFAVRHDVAHPFAVRARGAVAQDVGTRFDVRAYPEDARVRVVVVEGAVALGGQHAARPVTPTLVASGSLAEVDAAGLTTVAAVSDADRYLGWTRGELTFRHAPLSTIVADLSRFFGRPIRIGDAVIGAQLVSGTFSVDAPDEALDGLARAAGARAIRDTDGGTTFLRIP